MRCPCRRRRAHYSGSQDKDCAEVAVVEQAVHVRDSRNVTCPDFGVGCEERSRFMGFVAGS
ncbi:DUF397 domain-containing protein [Actinocorallia libanotica]|uniref:DUF397 domain-containing protein n=1 Tax=Actinocorallia libanotica TaxID=46162 RepID=UPI003CD07BA3